MIQHDGLDRSTREHIRRIARALAREDRELADDLEQETALTALELLPADVSERGPWLYGVVRNRLYTRRNRDARFRRSQEPDQGRLMRSEDVDDPALRLLRDELRESLLQKLDALPERYRLVIQLRVLEDLPPREVSRRVGLPVETVRSQVRRGLEMLRAQLGEESRWSALRRGLGALPIAGLRWWMGVPAAAAVAAAAALIIGRGPSLPHDPIQRGPGVAQLDPTESLGSPGGARARSIGPEATGSAGPDETMQPPEPQAAPRALELSVVRPDGRAAGEVEIFGKLPGSGVFAHERIGRTDGQGRLLVDDPERFQWLAARGEEGERSPAILVHQPSVSGADQLELQLQRFELHWVELVGVPDTTGTVFVYTSLPFPPRMIGIEEGEGVSALAHWIPAWRDASGRYGIPMAETGQRIVAIADGRTLWFEGAGKPDVLASIIDVASAYSVVGRVVDTAGAPAVGVLVQLQGDRRYSVGRLRRQRTGPDGTFRFDGANMDAAKLALDSEEPIEITRSPGDLLDLGDLQLEVSGGRRTTVRTSGLEGDVEVRAVTNQEKRVTLAQRIAGGDVRFIEAEEVSDNVYGIDSIGFDLAAVVITENAGGEAPPRTLILTGKRRKPLAADLDVTGPLPAWGELRLVVPDQMRPATIYAVERFSGLTFTHAVPSADLAGGGLDGSRDLERVIPLPAGSWKVAVLGPKGSFDRRSDVWIEPGQRMDLGDLSRETGTLEFDWSMLEESGDPDSIVQVELRQYTEVVYAAQLRRSELSVELAKQELDSRWYSVQATVDGVHHVGAGYVRPGEVTRCTVENERVVLTVRFRGRRRNEPMSGGTLRFLDAEGELLHQERLQDDISVPAQLIVMPLHPAEGGRLEVTRGAEAYAASVDIQRGQTMVNVWVAPVRARPAEGEALGVGSPPAQGARDPSCEPDASGSGAAHGGDRAKGGDDRVHR